MQNQMVSLQAKDAIAEEFAAVIPILPKQNQFELLGYLRAVRDLTAGKIPQPATDSIAPHLRL